MARRNPRNAKPDTNEWVQRFIKIVNLHFQHIYLVECRVECVETFWHDVREGLVGGSRAREVFKSIPKKHHAYVYNYVSVLWEILSQPRFLRH